MSLNIKDFLGQYVKPNALKLGGENAVDNINTIPYAFVREVIGEDTNIGDLYISSNPEAPEEQLINFNVNAIGVEFLSQGSGAQMYLNIQPEEQPVTNLLYAYYNEEEEKVQINIGEDTAIIKIKLPELEEGMAIGQLYVDENGFVKRWSGE
jgi:hypothetical protein